MAEYLQLAADKFTFRVATDRLYSPEGLWLQAEASSRVRIGLTDFMQQRSGDVAFLSVRSPGTKLHGGDDFAEIETVKVTQSIPCPIAGTIVEANKALEVTPEVVNQDPYGGGWVAIVEATNWEADRAKLLDASAYMAAMRSQVEQEMQAP